MTHMLGGGSIDNYDDIDSANELATIFDNYCKSFIKQAWAIRSNMKAVNQ